MIRGWDAIGVASNALGSIPRGILTLFIFERSFAMDNIFKTREPSFFGVSLGRELAIRGCVIANSLLNHEFNSTISDFERKFMPSDIWAGLIAEFAKKKGLRIIDEKPILRIEGNDYRVDIEYTITW